MLKKIIISSLLALLLSCSVSRKTYSPCEERCEYTRRDCIESCGGYDSAGFSISFGKGYSLQPFSCSERCEESAERCMLRCKSGE